ncbi:hypothetical protein X772_32330 [Mesorhizobium sp. LSJC280B00]|nr:hypothetical protein X772_32330 [Mesorhizobium sp. LSJC280B00]
MRIRAVALGKHPEVVAPGYIQMAEYIGHQRCKISFK